MFTACTEYLYGKFVCTEYGTYKYLYSITYLHTLGALNINLEIAVMEEDKNKLGEPWSNAPQGPAGKFLEGDVVSYLQAF